MPTDPKKPVPAVSEPSKASSGVVLQEIAVHDDGQRLDNYLFKHLKGVPKSKIYQIIRKGEVRLDKKRAKPSSKLQAGQLLRIPPVRQSNRQDSVEQALKLDNNQKKAEALKDAILYEDDYLMVINKPAGLAVHGGSGVSLGLIEMLRASREKHEFLELVHRLDKDTSGCLVVAKRGSTLRELNKLIREGQMEKRYCAIVSGRWKGAFHKVQAPLKKFNLQSGERMVRVSRDGKESETHFAVKERFANASFVEAHLLTGRTHQIRVHCQYAGHPIVGDTKYAFDNPEKDKTQSKAAHARMFLHARSLKLPLSIYEKALSIEAPLDDAFESYLNELRRGSEKHA